MEFNRKIEMSVPDLSPLSLLAALALLIIPVAVSFWLKLGIVKEILLASGRMGVQLFFAGFYLSWLFNYDSAWVNSGWLLVMMVVAALTTVQKSQLRPGMIFLPVCLSTIAGTLSVVLFFNTFIVRIDHIFEARYLVVLGGMILGNALSGNIVALTYFYQSLKERQSRYLFWIGNGATLFEAILPHFREAVIRSLKPMLARMATIGIVAIPGMMTGQMLGGASPLVATKYQIAIMTAIFATMTIGTVMAILLSVRPAFDDWGILKKEIFRRPLLSR